MTKGVVSSIQSLGTLDGPGVRFVVFVQGCNLRCGCCHNPETWPVLGGKEYSPLEIANKALRYREYFGEDGGITFSGGEPLLQAAFVREVFELCHKEGINTCLDTSGSILNDNVMSLIEHTDRVLLDIKYSTDELYHKYVGCGINEPLEFLRVLNERKIPVTIRQVVIPSLNDNDENISFINGLIKTYKCVDKVEMLPFKKMCTTKYQNMGIDFKFKSFPEPSTALITELYSKISI